MCFPMLYHVGCTNEDSEEKLQNVSLSLLLLFNSDFFFVCVNELYDILLSLLCLQEFSYIFISISLCYFILDLFLYE